MDYLADAMRNSVILDRLSQYAADIRRLEDRVMRLEAELIELKRPKSEAYYETALENLIKKGARYE